MISKIFKRIKCTFGFHNWVFDGYGKEYCWNCKKRKGTKQMKTEQEIRLQIALLEYTIKYLEITEQKFTRYGNNMVYYLRNQIKMLKWVLNEIEE